MGFNSGFKGLKGVHVGVVAHSSFACAVVHNWSAALLCDQTFSFVSSAFVSFFFNKTWNRVVVFFFVPWMTFVAKCCKSQHIPLHSTFCNELTLSYHRPFAAVQCQPSLLYVPTIQKLKGIQYSVFPFVAASEIVPQSTQVSETLNP